MKSGHHGTLEEAATVIGARFIARQVLMRSSVRFHLHLQEFHFMTDEFHFMTDKFHFMTEPTPQIVGSVIK